MDRVSYETDVDGNPYIQLGENILCFEKEELDEYYLEKAKNEIRETPENKKNGINILRQLIKDEPKLCVPLDDEFLLKFLRPSKFYPDSAFRVMKKFYRFKFKHPKFTANLMPQVVAKVYEDGMICFLPKRCKDGGRIMVVSAGSRWNTKQVPLALFIKAALVAVEIAMGEPRTQVAGVHIILDMEGLSMSHIWQFTPSLAKLVCNVVTESVAIRLLGYNIINQSVLFDILYNLFKPFLGEKIRKRLFFHGCNWESLHEKVDADCLPKHLGGSLNSPECPGHLLTKVLRFYDSDYEKYNSYGYGKIKVDVEA